jgi:predicted AAA+ superfamily ATPase
MKTVFETCKPRPEVLKGELRDEMFAARLKDVIDGSADAVYGNAGQFNDNTFWTDGLQTLVREVLGRLSGKSPANSPFIRLETSFGGGKTHNLIALYHLSQGHSEGLPPKVVEKSWVPKTAWPCAGLVGSDMDPANGIDHGDVRTRTLWGELAYQLRRKDGYEIVRSSDETLVAPGTQVLEKLLGAGPALIMLDEVARYLRAAKAVVTTNKKSDLGEQAVAFLMTLIEYAASKERVAVVVTLADSKDAFGDETDQLRMDLLEARRVSARQERVITPTGDAEISRIVTHRLFRSIDREAGEKAAQEFASYYAELARKGADLPSRALRAEYAAEIAQDYPFHPEFLATLNHKTSTIPNFQKTRGALRLLARVVRRVWDEKPKDAFTVAVHHLDLGLDDVANDLTSRLERPAFRSVIEADIVSPRQGSEAHCQTIDRKWLQAGKPPYARRTAIGVFLHSLTQGIATGVDPADLLLATVQPGDDPELVRKAIALMLGEEKGEPGSACWFLHWDGHRYRFKTEPSLEKVVQDELGMVGRTKAKAELDERIRRIWKKGVVEPEAFPAEAAGLDDDAGAPKLAIIHYDAATTSAGAAAPPDLVAKLFNHAGTLEGYRTYKNNVLFLVADEDQVERMVDVAQRYLAVRRIASDTDRMSEFNEEQRKRLKAMQDTAELDVRIAITRTYRWLYYPSTDAPRSAGGLSREALPAQEQGDVEKDQSAVLLRVLKQLDKVITADDAAMPAAYVKAKAWSPGQASLSTEDLRREFAKRLGLKMLLDLNQLKKTIKAGVAQGTWVYFDSAEQVGYAKNSPPPLIQVSEDALLYTPEEAARLGLRIKGVETTARECPLCHQHPCVCGEEEGEGAEAAPGTKKRLHARAEGAPAQVFQAIADQFHDAKAGRLARLLIRCEGAGKEAAADARSLGLAIPQLGKGSYAIEQTLNAEFGEAPAGERFSLTFSGSWDRYKRVKQLTDAFGQEASKVSLRMSLRASYEGGLALDSDQFLGMRDVFSSLGVGRIQVEADELETPEGVE